MNYVDGFITPVRTADQQAYREHARDKAKNFKELGALNVVECWGDDVPEGKFTSFPLAVKLEPDEAVVFSWVTWLSKAVRDAGWAKVMADPRMQPGVISMPFDGKRMIYGGFQIIAKHDRSVRNTRSLALRALPYIQFG